MLIWISSLGKTVSAAIMVNQATLSSRLIYKDHAGKCGSEYASEVQHRPCDPYMMPFDKSLSVQRLHVASMLQPRSCHSHDGHVTCRASQTPWACHSMRRLQASLQQALRRKQPQAPRKQRPPHLPQQVLSQLPLSFQPPALSLERPHHPHLREQVIKQLDPAHPVRIQTAATAAHLQARLRLEPAHLLLKFPHLLPQAQSSQRSRWIWKVIQGRIQGVVAVAQLQLLSQLPPPQQIWGSSPIRRLTWADPLQRLQSAVLGPVHLQQLRLQLGNKLQQHQRPVLQDKAIPLQA